MKLPPRSPEVVVPVLLDLYCWLAADSLLQPDGLRLHTWGDLSGRFNTARQSTFSARPTLVANQLNGLNVVKCSDAVTQGLRFIDTKAFDFEFTDPWTVMHVSRRTGASMSIIGKLTTSVFGWLPFLVIGTSGSIGCNGPGGKIEKIYTAMETTNWHVWTSTYDGSVAAAGLNLYKDGVLQAPNSSTSTAAGQSMKHGVAATINPGGMNGEIAELVVYNRVLTVAERQSMEAYFMQKYALA